MEGVTWVAFDNATGTTGSATQTIFAGYSGVAIDPEHPGTIMVTAYSSWWPDTIIWRSTNDGSTWNQIWNWTSCFGGWGHPLTGCCSIASAYG